MPPYPLHFHPGMLIANSSCLDETITSGVSARRVGNNVPSRHSLKAQMSKSETWLQGGTVDTESIGATKLPIPLPHLGLAIELENVNIE